MNKQLIATGLIIVLLVVGLSGCIDESSSSNYWQEQYNSLYDEYDNLIDDYNNLVDEYGILYAPSTLIKNGTVYWRFNKLDGTVAEWTVDIDTYRSYIDWPEPTEYTLLYNTNTGENYNVKNLSNYVQPDFFVNVISTLTDGKTDSEFVAGVVNFKNQIVTYGSGLGDYYRWSAETLTEGRGQCGDTSILMASLLKAGENEAEYGLKVYFWYCDADHMTDPQDVNHVIVEVEYADESSEFIETTSDGYYSYDQIVGWPYEV